MAVSHSYIYHASVTCLLLSIHFVFGEQLIGHVEENLPKDKDIINVIKASTLSTVSVDNGDVLMLNINGATPLNSEKLFTIDMPNGTLRTSNVINREQFCAGQTDCVIDLEISVGPIKYFRIINIKIFIDDINDNGPHFPERTVKKFISEATRPSTEFSIPLAEDADSPMFGVKRYILGDERGVFSLNTETAASGEITGLRLVLIETLNRENRDYYQLIVQAVDGGSPPRTDTIMLHVTVLDVNDNSPEFSNRTYNLALSEDFPVNVTFLSVLAVDRDAGENGHVIYGFSRRTLASYGDQFSIDAQTGALSAHAPLDREDVPIYRLYVTARDSGPEALSDQATVIITLTDVNDNGPKIKVHGAEAEIGIPENSHLGSTVVHLSVQDPDARQNALFNCSLDTTWFALETISTGEYVIITLRSLDREQMTDYLITVTCKDLGQPPQVTKETIKVNILDVNDNIPVFTKKLYIVEMKENNPTNQLVTQVVAIDTDAGINGEVMYDLESSAAGSFTVDATSGVITAHTRLDYETQREHRFLVYASDLGPGSEVASATIIVHVTNTDDESPKFVQSEYNFMISYDVPPGSVLGTVKAIDKDDDPYNKFSYAINNTYRVFFIEPSEGILVTTQRIPHDVNEYNFVVTAQGGVNPQRSGFAEVKVHVDHERSTGNSINSGSGEPGRNLIIIIVVIVTSALCVTVLSMCIIVLLIRSRRQKRNGGFHDKNLTVVPATGHVWNINTPEVNLNTMATGEQTRRQCSGTDERYGLPAANGSNSLESMTSSSGDSGFINNHTRDTEQWMTAESDLSKAENVRVQPSYVSDSHLACGQMDSRRQSMTGQLLPVGMSPKHMSQKGVRIHCDNTKMSPYSDCKRKGENINFVECANVMNMRPERRLSERAVPRSPRHKSTNDLNLSASHGKPVSRKQVKRYVSWNENLNKNSKHYTKKSGEPVVQGLLTMTERLTSLTCDQINNDNHRRRQSPGHKPHTVTENHKRVILPENISSELVV